MEGKKIGKITFAGTAIIIGSIPLLFAAVQPSVWSVYAGLITVLFIIQLWDDQTDISFPKSRSFVFSGSIFFLFTLFQILPLPSGILDILSPFRWEMLKQSETLRQAACSGHSLSYIDGASLAWWIFLVSLALFFSIFQTVTGSRRRLVLITGIVVGVALFESIYGLLQALVPTLGVLWVDYITSYLGDARGTFINRNHFAGYIEMAWPLGLGLLLAYGNVWQKREMNRSTTRNRLKNLISTDRIGIQLLLITALLIILLALLFSKSRAGIMGAFIGFISFLVLSHIGGKKFSAVSWTTTGLGFGFLLLYGHIIGFGEIIGRFFEVSDNAGSRIDVWRNTLAMIKDHPFGIGLKNFENVFPVYNYISASGIRFTHAHNDYLQLLAEAGWPGFLALIGGFFFFLVQSIKRIRLLGPSIDPIHFFIGIGALCGLISIAFHSFFDFNLQIPANCLYFVMLLALVYGCFWKTDARE